MVLCARHMLKTNFLPPRRIVGELPKTARQNTGGQALQADGGQALHTTAGSTTLQTDAGLLLYAIYKNYVEKMFKICII